MSVKSHEAQTITIEVDESYNASEREAIAEDIVDKIVDNTLKGVDKNGKQFVELSKEYAAFKRKAVGSSKANLRLSSEMLGALKYIKSKSGKGRITVGYKGGTTQNAKAKNHRLGETVPKRDFLGLPDKQVKRITNKYPVESKAERAKALAAALELRKRLRGDES